MTIHIASLLNFTGIFDAFLKQRRTVRIGRGRASRKRNTNDKGGGGNGAGQGGVAGQVGAG